MLIPVVVDACSLERMAANTNPDVPRFRFTIANATTANTTATIAYISSRSVMPMPNGRAIWTPAPKFSYSLRVHTNCSTSSAKPMVRRAR